MEFYNFNNQLQRLFVVFADSECFFATKPDEPGKLQKHEPTSAAFYSVNTFNCSKNKTWSYVGKDCVSKIIIELSNWLKNATRRYRKTQYMNIAIKSKFKLEKATYCYLCKEILYKAKLQGHGPLPQNRRIPWGSSQHV